MEQEGFERTIYRVAISLVILGLGLLSTLFVISLILFIREIGEESPSVGNSLANFIGSVARVLPLTLALAAASIMLSKGLSLLLRVKELSEASN